MAKGEKATGDPAVATSGSAPGPRGDDGQAAPTAVVRADDVAAAKSLRAFAKLQTGARAAELFAAASEFAAWQTAQEKTESKDGQKG